MMSLMTMFLAAGAIVVIVFVAVFAAGKRF